VEIVTKQGHPDFLDLPWDQPLEEWDDPRLVKMAHGISRHIVRFVRFGERVYALKATGVVAAHHEYRVLRDLRDDHLPVVEPVGVVSDAPNQGDGVLITRYLDFSLPYWYLLGRGDSSLADRLMDAGVVLLVRLHLEGVYWGDCSLSNILWRRDAGAMMAYLVDAETTERHATIGDRMRAYDVDIAVENVAGGLYELIASGRITDEIDPVAIAESLRVRYEQLWSELTRVDTIDLDERWRIEQRVRRINQLGFDVEELSINRDGRTLSVKPALIEEGHHARDLRARTGLDVQENQARRLLSDIDQFRAWLERKESRSIPRAVATARWLAEVYEPIIQTIPDELRSRLEPAEIFHQLLEHRYLLAERRGEDVTNQEALEDYLDSVLAASPKERQLRLDTGSIPRILFDPASVTYSSGTVEPVSERAERARRAIGLIDLTDLSDDHAPDGIDELCRRAREHGTAAVCVWPEYVARCVELLDGSDVRVATVVNFPSGDESVDDVIATTKKALADGADDIDLVLPYRAFLSGNPEHAGAMVDAIELLVEPPALLKVILETGAYPDTDSVAAAAHVAIENGADFVKTSTGKIAQGASLEVARAMLGEIAAAAADGRTVGLKPSGGIRSYEDAMAYLDLADEVMGEGWATPATFRYGASGVLDALLAEVDGTAPPAPTSAY
jgi:deoxyribose-phosphate aldolase